MKKRYTLKGVVWSLKLHNFDCTQSRYLLAPAAILVEGYAMDDMQLCRWGRCSVEDNNMAYLDLRYGNEKKKDTYRRHKVVPRSPNNAPEEVTDGLSWRKGAATKLPIIAERRYMIPIHTAMRDQKQAYK